jgi:hypothetical protein
MGNILPCIKKNQKNGYEDEDIKDLKKKTIEDASSKSLSKAITSEQIHHLKDFNEHGDDVK